MNESEFLIAKWEAKADELEKSSRLLRDSMTNLSLWHLEKSRAFRACASDLRRNTELRKSSKSKKKP